MGKILATIIHYLDVKLAAADIKMKILICIFGIIYMKSSVVCDQNVNYVGGKHESVLRLNFLSESFQRFGLPTFPSRLKTSWQNKSMK